MPTPSVVPRTFALGVGLTNACDLSCAHCYRGLGTDELSIEQVLSALDLLPTRAVNFGTGENGLHPRFGELVDALAARGVTVTMTTNGRSAAVLSDATLATMSDVEFSIDFPTRESHDAARAPGNWDLIEEQMARCRRLEVSTTIIAVMMSSNHRAMPELARLAGSRGALLRVNVYQPVKSDLMSLRYEQFWGAWRALLATADVVTCGEPIVRAMLGLPRVAGAGCGVQTVRITPTGDVVPCVYGGDRELSLDDLRALGAGVVDTPAFRRMRALPAACRACIHRDSCGGGCASRRNLRDGLETPDEFCPIARGEPLHLEARFADLGRTMAKAASACTTILRPRA
ncbi:MAG: hypothetical protein NVSMB47_01250 [Polyangiales bacterium]